MNISSWRTDATFFVRFLGAICIAMQPLESTSVSQKDSESCRNFADSEIHVKF